jgi:hypothetical protein
LAAKKPVPGFPETKSKLSEHVYKSGQFNLYAMTEGDNPRPCCFCPEQIEGEDKYQLMIVNNKPRRAHLACVQMALTKLIEMRDAKGKSEDLKR